MSSSKKITIEYTLLRRDGSVYISSTTGEPHISKEVYSLLPSGHILLECPDNRSVACTPEFLEECSPERRKQVELAKALLEVS